MKLGTLVYLKRNNQTLMLHRVKKKKDIHEGKWNGLGGKIEGGESPEECAIREVKEESGFDIVNPQLKGIMTFPKFDGVDDWYVYIFTAAEISGDQIESPEGNLSWIDDEKVIDLPMWEGDYIFLDWVDQGRFFSAKFVYKNKMLQDHTVVFYELAG
jgi:8-oxo-dGTP diphosphatase